MEDNVQQPQPGPQPDTIVVPDAKVTAPTKIVFGLDSFNLKTPESARNFFKLFLLISTISVIVVNGFPEMPLQVKNYILEGSAVITLIVNKIEDMFGLSNTSK